MYRNNDFYSIDFSEVWEGSEIKVLLEMYIEGAQIVFITKEERLLGGISRGDLKRSFNKNNFKFDQFINKNIKHIIFINEKQVFEEAKQIFNNKKIHNIPVVSKSGVLLFQIDRFCENKFILEDLENITYSANNGSIQSFIKSDNIKEIILTGSDRKSLYKTRQIFYEFHKELILSRNIVISIKENIKDVYLVDDSIKIISLSEFGYIYLKYITKLKIDIIMAKELCSFIELKAIKKFNKDIINDFKEIFRYNSIGFAFYNKYIYTFIKLLEDCNIKCFHIKENEIYKKYIDNDYINNFDIFLFSGSENIYCEKFSIIEMIQDIQLIQKYTQISGRNLTNEIYISECIDYLYKLQRRGFSGFIQEINSYWKEKLYREIKARDNLKVISSLEDIDYNIKYIINYRNMPKLVLESIYMSVTTNLYYICECAFYNVIIKRCKNIFTYSTMFSDNRQVFYERNRNNYLLDNDFFQENFSSEICNNNQIYLKEVIKNIDDCRTVEINDGYVKFLSNYHSKYFNTDLYGNRVVVGNPKKHFGTIWLIGSCIFSGYAVEDKHTLPSLLQEKINEMGYKYKVIDLSCDHGSILTLYNKILDKEIKLNDIIILDTSNFFTESNFIEINYEEMDNYLKDHVWFWDAPGHMGLEGYKFCSEKIFNIVKRVMLKELDNYKFYIEKDLELEIKNELKINKTYQTVYNNISSFYPYKQIKIGAIIMNCNPFTYGHQYLVDIASKLVDLLYIFVVEENKSVFSFEKRFSMVKEGVTQYENVVVLPSGGFMISSVTFPGYFSKEIPLKDCYDDFLDIKIFENYIMPNFEISVRFIGEEPLDKVTSQYNCDMKEILGNAGINVIEIPRKMIGNEIISATKVRNLLLEKEYNLLKKYVPETTLKYL